MVNYIKHIVWRFAKHEPENFKLLDVRYNVMKSLILSDCDHLIKFILFGEDEDATENKNACREIEINEKSKKIKRQKEPKTRHIPRDGSWPGKKFLIDDDLNFDEKKDGIKDNEKIEPNNNMELAIYHCKGKSLKLIFMAKHYLSR
jgi:hypothetical protein